jgi:glutaredoxin
MAIIRWLLGSLILFFNWLFTPRGIKRDPKLQAQIDLQTTGLKLYQYQACPFCVKVRRAMKRQSLTIETRDVKRSDIAREELLAGGVASWRCPVCGLRMWKARLSGSMSHPILSAISRTRLLPPRLSLLPNKPTHPMIGRFVEVEGSSWISR